ncbi:MAG: hypothetical protein ACYTEQ_18435, partial [Planctomycetota bacterium]
MNLCGTYATIEVRAGKEKLGLTEKEAIYYELLVLRCRRGQKDAFEELVRDWQMRLFYYIRRLVDDEQTAWQLL